MGNDEEFKRQWQLYKQTREALIKVDPKLFDQLRDIPLPQPDKSNSFYLEHGLYFTHDIEPLKNEVDLAIKYFQLLEQSKSLQTSSIEAHAALNLIFQRFHKVARQVRSRHDQRDTLSISDEYDVQDLLHALLSIYFDDIRAEEWTPSYAGSSSRMDFLLKPELTQSKQRCLAKALMRKPLASN